MDSSNEKSWNEQRHGFKHELVLTLLDSKKFGQREAERTVKAILEAIKAALLNGDTVSVEGFGAWLVEKVPPEKRRQWRCGKIMKLKTRKIRFKLEDYRLTLTNRTGGRIQLGRRMEGDLPS